MPTPTPTPILELVELVNGQAVPEQVVNENGRWYEFFSTGGAVIDRDLAAPPGSPADGDAYLVDASATGAWAGHDGEIALRISTAWEFKTPKEGMQLYVRDEDVRIVYDGSDWNDAGASGGSGSGYTPGGTDVAVADGGTGASTAAGARTNLAAAAQSQTGEQISGFIASPSDKSYTIGLDMKHGGTITEVTTQSASGTCTATFKINSTALGGTANSVSSSETTQAHASSNVWSAGDNLVLTISSNSSCVDLAFTIKYTRTLG